MNYLAHFHLAWPDPSLMAGGLEGDYCKGPLYGQLPPGLERGVKLHRAIDAYTDAHHDLAKLRRRLPPSLRRYSGIVIDLCFDHFLAQHWRQFSQVPLTRFNANVYRCVGAQKTLLSTGAQNMLDRMREHDLLGLYEDWTTIPRAAARIGERFRRDNPFLELEEQLAPLYSEIETSFFNFYPQLQHFVTERRSQLSLHNCAVREKLLG